MHAPRRRSTITVQPSWSMRTPMRPTGIGLNAGPVVTVTIDQVAIDRRLTGDMTVRLTKYEKREAARQAIARGLEYHDVARITGLSGTSLRVALAEALPAAEEPIAWWPTEHQLATA